MSIKPTTALINFLTNAYKMPSSVRETLIDNHDSIEERNVGAFIALLYFRVMKVQEFTSFEQAKSYLDTITEEELDEMVTGLLAHAVLLTFMPEDHSI